MRTVIRILILMLVLMLIGSSVQIAPGMPMGTSSRSPGADVVVVQVIKMAPNFPKVGENVTLNATITNVGNVNATNVTITAQANNDTLAQPIDLGTFYYGSDLGQQNITNSTPGNKVHLWFYWNTSLPNLTVEEGLVYTITVTAHNETDDNITNGTASTFFDFKPPDIEDPFVNGISVTPSTIIVGENVTVNASFRNDGALPVQDRPVFFFVDYNWSGTNDDVHNETVDIDQFNMSSTFIEFQLNTTGYSTGNHTLTALIPFNGANLTSDNFTIDPIPPPPGKPDLTVLSLGLNRSSVLQGEEVNLTVTIKNVGNEASLPTKVNITDLVGTFTVEFDLSAFDPGSEKVHGVTIDTGQLSIGVHRLQVWVDKPNVNEESDEANNTKIVILLVNSKPDLTVSDPIFYLGSTVTPISKAIQGDKVTVLIPVRNIGLNSSLNGTKISLFLDNITVLIGEKVLLPYAPGASFNVTFKWNTSSVPVGKRKIIVEVDSEDTNVELDEDNNMASANLTIQEVPRPPDLTLRTISFSRTTISAGDKVSINLTVANIGEGVAENIDLTAELENTQGALIRVLNETIVAYMAGDSMQPMALTWDLSEALSPGDYVVRITIDPKNLIDETDETNNENTTTIKVIEKVVHYTDILITEISFEPSKPKVGQKVNITVSILNRGNKDARDLTVSLFIDGKNIDEIPVALLSKDNGMVSVSFEHRFESDGSHSIKASVFDGGVSQYSMTQDTSVKKGTSGEIEGDTIMIILVILLVIAIIVTLVAGGRRKKGPDDEDLEDIEEEEEEEEESLTKDEMLAEEE